MEVTQYVSNRLSEYLSAELGKIQFELRDNTGYPVRADRFLKAILERVNYDFPGWTAEKVSVDEISIRVAEFPDYRMNLVIRLHAQASTITMSVGSPEFGCKFTYKCIENIVYADYFLVLLRRLPPIIREMRKLADHYRQEELERADRTAERDRRVRERQKRLNDTFEKVKTTVAPLKLRDMSLYFESTEKVKLRFRLEKGMVGIVRFSLDDFADGKVRLEEVVRDCVELNGEPAVVYIQKGR